VCLLAPCTRLRRLSAMRGGVAHLEASPRSASIPFLSRSPIGERASSRRKASRAARARRARGAAPLQAELQTERKRIVLYDNTNNLLPMLPSQGRHDFIVEHDLKEIGTHTCVTLTRRARTRRAPIRRREWSGLLRSSADAAPKTLNKALSAADLASRQWSALRSVRALPSPLRSVEGVASLEPTAAFRLDGVGGALLARGGCCQRLSQRGRHPARGALAGWCARRSTQIAIRSASTSPSTSNSRWPTPWPCAPKCGIWR